MFKTPQQVFEISKKYFESFPKTFDEAKEVGEKIKRVAEVEQENAKAVFTALNKASRGDASLNEINAVNRKAQDLAVAARFAAFTAMPGAILALPFVIEASKLYDFEFIPKSVEKEFGL